MKFIDLFAGLGGFHLALDKLGHTCVFACDIEEDPRKTYAQNFGLMPAGDIRQVDVRNIPQHDILCAGFPCQPFSKAGFQLGLKDKERGGLFYDILRIIQHHYPTFLIMENVPNIKNHNNRIRKSHLPPTAQKHDRIPGNNGNHAGGINQRNFFGKSFRVKRFVQTGLKQRENFPVHQKSVKKDNRDDGHFGQKFRAENQFPGAGV